MFCTGCGTQATDSDVFCGGCGNAQRGASGSVPHAASKPAIFRVGQALQQPAIPDGVRGWSWGAFLLNWIWAIGNHSWIGLLALIPYVNVPVSIWLGIKGREMAWRNGRWDSVEHFNRVQRAWSRWAVGIVLAISALITLCVFMAIPATQETDDAVVQRQDNPHTARVAS